MYKPRGQTRGEGVAQMTTTLNNSYLVKVSTLFAHAPSVISDQENDLKDKFCLKCNIKTSENHFIAKSEFKILICTLQNVYNDN